MLQDGNEWLLDAVGRTRWIRRRRRSHESQALKQKYRSLGGAPPDQLTAFALAILHVDITARVFQTAILENTVDVNTIVQNDVLILKSLIFETVHLSPSLQVATTC